MSTILSSKMVLLGGEPAHWCPGCDVVHRFNVNQPNPYTQAHWTWNGDAVRPTFSPSMVVRVRWSQDVEFDPRLADDVCHYFLRDGRIEFLGDCTHKMVGQTVDLPDLPDHYLQRDA